MYRLAAIVFLTLGLAGQQPETATFKTTTRLVVSSFAPGTARPSII
jgi:hypothetical protein